MDFETEGLEGGKSYLIRGDSGTGKTVFGIQFLLEGLRNNEAGVLITMENPKDILFYARSMGMDLTEEVKNNRLIVLEYPLDVEGFARPSLDFGEEDILKELSRYIQENHSQRLVIDTINPLYLFANNASPSQFGRTLLGRFGDLGTTAILLEDPVVHAAHQDVSAAMEPLLHGVFELTYGEEGFLRRFKVKKLKGKGKKRSEYRFEIRYAEGLVAVEEGQASQTAPEDHACVPPHFLQQLTHELKRAKRFNQPLSILIFSLTDLIKKEERRFYEEWIKDVIRVCRVNSREFDTVARYSNEKIIAILPATDIKGAGLYARKIKETVPEVEQDVGIGIATYPVDAWDEDGLVQKAFSELRPSHL